MTAQTVYNKTLAVALAGLIYDMGNTDIDSFAAETDVPFGTFVSRGTDGANQVILGGAAAIGISVRTAQENEYGGIGGYDGDKYAIKETVGVLREGYIWAQFDAAGGAAGAVVTIDAEGKVVAAGGGIALTAVKAVIERPAVDITVGGTGATGVFVGLVKVYAA